MGLLHRYELAVMMVCTANVCRSPMAEGMMRRALEIRGAHRRILVASAGTRVGQPGRPADPRARKVCLEAGIDLSRCRARQVRDRDFLRFDHMLAMDRGNEKWLLEHRAGGPKAGIALIGNWMDDAGALEIPDPYYGNLEGFKLVFSILQQAIDGFLTDLLDGNQ